jgi:hypothetical protein
MIDAEAFDDYVPKYAPSLLPLFSSSNDDDASFRCMELVRDSEFLLCTSVLRGYSLSAKAWGGRLPYVIYMEKRGLTVI